MAKRIVSGANAALAGVALAAFIGGGFGIQAARAQDAGSSVTVDVGECVNLQSPEERFACYERQVGAARTAPPPAPPPGAPESASAAEGRPEPAGDPVDATESPDKTAESQEFVATITALRQTVPNRYVITLDNGQVWRQTYTEWYPLRPGLEVTLRPSRWGGTFSLTAAEHGGFIQVQRVR